MTVIWCDTETTGLNPINSAPFELAFLVYDGGNFIEEKVFYLNPLKDEVVIHQSALDINRATEEQIRGYPPAKEVAPEIIKFFEKHCPKERLIFAGYNCPFDYKQVGNLILREGFTISDYFNGRLIDVLELVRQAKKMKLLDNKVDDKLETMTKSLGIEHDAAHTALSDIKAARRLYEIIHFRSKGRKA